MNKIGVNEYKLRDIEKKIVNFKLNLLDETFIFNEDEFDLKYLKKLNDFLFQDFYFEEELGYRYESGIELSIIENKLYQIKKICIHNPEKIEEILNLIYEIWDLQPFMVGNTRTMIAFLKILNMAYLLDLEIDVNKKIISSPSMFKLNNIVNQKRLTKPK